MDTDVVDTDVAATCADWCTAVTTACTDANDQFPADNCLALCAASGIPAGTAGETSGNSIGCRAYHAGVAGAGDATAKTDHCPHAGLFGGGVCGMEIPNFCDMNAHVCTTTAYASINDCEIAAATFPTSGSPGDASGDTLQCRQYHLGVAATVSAVDHCGHTAADGGGVCVDAVIEL